MSDKVRNLVDRRSNYHDCMGIFVNEIMKRETLWALAETKYCFPAIQCLILHSSQQVTLILHFTLLPSRNYET